MNELIRQVKQLRKKNPEVSFEDMKKPLYQTLERVLPPFPEAMVEEAWQYFILPAGNFDDLERAADFVDFCHDNLELDRSVLTEEDWLFIRDLVNMFAQELELDFISFVMGVILDKGLISKT